MFFVLVCFFHCASTQNIDTTVDGLHITVTGNQNIPQYDFYLIDKPEEIYSLRLHQMYEAVDSKKEGPVTNPTQWEFSPLISTDTGVEFNMTHLQKGSDRFTQLQFRNTISYKNSSNNPCPNSVCLKFDVLIDDYEWWSADPTATLVMNYWLTFQNDSVQNSLSAQKNKASVGNSWFTISETASAFNGGNQTSVSVSLLSDDSGVTVTYSHFTGSLVHDPLLGIGSQPQRNIGLFVGIGVAIVVVLVVIFAVLYFRRRSEYESVH